jgi:hypothetical protein
MTEDIREEPQSVSEADAPERETDTSPEPAAPPPKAWSDEDEDEARLFGWKSPDEWQGEKPPGYIDRPQDFLDRVKRSRVFQTMEEKMAEQERKLAAMSDMALKRQRAEYEGRLAQIGAAQRRAVEEADTEAYDRLEQQRQSLLEKPPETPPETPKPNDEAARALQEYEARNDWVKDPVFRSEAAQIVGYALQYFRQNNATNTQVSVSLNQML